MSMVGFGTPTRWPSLLITPTRASTTCVCSPDAPDHGAVLGERRACQDCLMQHKSQRASALAAAACPTESRLSHLISLNPGESHLSRLVPLNPSESHLSHLVPFNPGESHLSQLIPLCPGESRFKFLPRARCRPWPRREFRVSRGDSPPPPRAASQGRRPCRCWAWARRPGGRAR